MPSPSPLAPTISGSPASQETAAAASPAPTAPHNLPAQPTGLLGRAGEIELVDLLLQRGDVRLLTLTGPGGVGKTRLALAAAGAARGDFPDGVWFVDLAAVSDPTLIMPVIGHVLGVRDASVGSADALVPHLSGRSVLLVLDNMEHLLDAASTLDALLAASPELTVLATSREPLHLRREHVVEVPPLPVPDPEQEDWTVEELSAIPGVALFVERARAANAAFTLTTANAPAVAEICRRLDGLPLALELAAARTRLLDPVALVARLEQGLALLRWDAPDLPPRQRTLRATLDWSHALLSSDEQAVFRRLGVFAGGFTLDAVTAVVATDELGLDPLDALAGLADKHLVRVLAQETGEPRFGLLATVREYALAQLAAGEEDEVRERHLRYYLTLAEQARQTVREAEDESWLARLDAEDANLRAALEWAVASGKMDDERRLVAAMWPVWMSRGALGEGLARIEAALSRPGSAEPALQAQILTGAGLFADWAGDEQQAAAWFDQGLAEARTAGETALAAELLGHLARLAYADDDAERARELAAEMLALARPAADERLIGLAYIHLVMFATGPAGSLQERQRLLAELDAPVAMLRETGDRRILALLLAGQARLLAGDPAALPLLDESLELAQELDDPPVMSFVPWLAAVLLVEQLLPERAARLVTAVTTIAMEPEATGDRNLIDVYSTPADWAVLERAATSARESLEPALFAAAEAAGQALSFAEVVDEALAAVTEAAGAAETDRVPTAVGTDGLLSPREREVLALVAAGRSNREIAEALFVSPNTIKTHVSSLLSKLGAGTRTQLAVIASEHGLR